MYLGTDSSFSSSGRPGSRRAVRSFRTKKVGAHGRRFSGTQRFYGRRIGRGMRKWQGGLGAISTLVGQTPTLVFSSNPIANPIVVRGPVGIAPIGRPIQYRPIQAGGNWPGPTGPWSGGSTFAPWQSGYGGGGYGGSGWSAAGSPYGSTPTNPTNSAQLAQAQLILQTNPSLLTQQQFTLLQQAGLVSNTLPYSSVAQMQGSATTSSASGIDPATGVPYATELAEAQAAGSSGSSIGSSLSASYAGLPLWGWLAIGGGAFFLLSGRRR